MIRKLHRVPAGGFLFVGREATSCLVGGADSERDREGLSRSVSTGAEGDGCPSVTAPIVISLIAGILIGALAGKKEYSAKFGGGGSISHRKKMVAE